MQVQMVPTNQKCTSLIKQNRKKFEIEVLAHNGAAFCTECDRVVLVGDCSHSIANGRYIRSNFRASLKKNLFKLADENMQYEIFKLASIF